jgi:hypothetical protein
MDNVKSEKFLSLAELQNPNASSEELSLHTEGDEEAYD